MHEEKVGKRILDMDMTSVTSSSNRSPQARSLKLTGPSNIKQASYRKNLESNLNSVGGNAHKAQELEYTRPKQRLNYDTVDSAYSTSESSYNTVDSTYSQRSNSSGYSTLDLKWKRPQSNLLEKNRNPTGQDGHPIAGPIDPDSAVKAFDISSADQDPIKFVDDPEGSDTATETETDTELNISSCTVDLDMSYVPDYVRPMMAPMSVVAITTTTSSFTISRPALTSTMTSPSVSMSSSTLASPVGSVKDESIGLSPNVARYKCTDRTTSYAGYRENYSRTQKEKLCGRKSLDERLKSLETGAAVRLQVCKGSQSRRRKPEPKGMVSTTKSMYSSPGLYSRPRSPTRDLEEGSMKQDLQIEPTPTRAPPPDIIESHQPPSNAQENHSDIDHDRSDSLAGVKLARPVEAAFSSEPRANDVDNNKVAELFAKPESRHHVAITWKAATVPLADKKQPPAAQQPITTTTSKQSNKQASDRLPDLNGAMNSKTPQSPTRTDPVPARLKWKQPSQEALNRLHDVTEPPQNPPVNVPTTSSKKIPGEAIEEIKVEDRNDGPLKQKEVPRILVVDVNAAMHVTAPVELRSPKIESGRGNTYDMHDRRNARMFPGASSADSDSDSMLTKKTTENKPFHIAPVKFVPSVLCRSRSRSAKEEEGSQTSSTSSLVADVKASTNEDDPLTSSSKPKETRRKSSRSPKRTNLKRSVRSKSSHERPRTESKKHTRTLSSDNRSPVSVTHSNGDQRGRKSPETPIHRTTEQPKDPTSRSRSHNRHKPEYSELSNVPRTPRSASKFAEPSSLPSPRQLAVAQMVKFGFSGNEGAIPYIDDNNSPEEQKKTLVNESAKLRAASEELFFRDADTSTIRKAFPLSRRGRSIKKKDGPRRISYMEAMGSSDDLTPDTDGSGYAAASAGSEYENAASLGKFGRSTSADSILSTADARPGVTLRSQHVRANSADRSSLKGAYRRSYQIATTKPTNKLSSNNDLLRPSSHKRQPSIRRLKNFFAENTQQMVEGQTNEGRRGSKGRLIGPIPTLTLNEYDDTVAREGFLSFKVATIEKGKRTSAQKSWKLIWVVLKQQSLYLCKDWNRNKPDSSPVISVNTNSPGSASPPSQLILEEEDPLNIQGSLVSIAYNYVKRKNVFKVTTCNGSEYLFQADDRDDMLAWINSIQVKGNHDNKDGEVTINEDLILRKTSQIESGPKPEKRSTRKSRSPKPTRRMTVPIKDIDGSRRFKWRGSVNRIVRKFGQGQTLMQGGTFDVHLEDCPPSINNELVPSVVELCCRIVEERGLSFTGIYRVPGNSGTLSALQEELNIRGAEAVDLENDERFRELNVVSSLLKSFFRKLPDPLFTNELYDDFITMNRKKDTEERINGLRRLIHMLPAPHYETLKFLIGHLRKVADNCEVNKMEVRNLAIVFGPTLVRSSVCDNMATMVTDMSDQCRIVESVLQHAHWFFSDDENESTGVRNLPVPTDDHHDPVPNIDHLLANVGRTPGDASDSTSESSKSKVSCASEKESFSRDVMEMIFGAGKRWLQNPQQRDTKDDAGEESSDDEFGFKEAMRKQAQAAEKRPKSPPLVEKTSSAPTKYQVAKPAATGIRAAWPNKGEHFSTDIPARLYDFYLENLERLTTVNDTSRPFAHFTSSSPETSPQVTPRGSLFVPPLPPVQRNYSLQGRRSSDGRLRNIGVFSQNDTHRQTSLPAPMSTPLSRKPNASEPNLLYPTHGSGFEPVLVTSTPLKNGSKVLLNEPVQSAHSRTEVKSADNIGSHNNEESDSDSSIYVGETLEEKLKNLTNLEKKLERRPSRRHTNRHHGVLLKLTTPFEAPSQSTNKKLTTAPSLQAGELITPDNLHMYPTKKTTRELYQERKAQRQQQRELVKAKRNNRKDDVMLRCASDENVFNRFDPKRKVLRSSSREDGNPAGRSRQSKEKVKRRHTLGGNDFPPQETWDKTHHASMQDLSPQESAMARLRPRFKERVSSAARPIASNSRFLARTESYKSEKGRKTESYI